MPTSSSRPRLRSPFAVGAGLGLIGVLLLGWFTGMRGVMHALLVTLGAVAPVPFALLLGLAALLAAAGLAGALLADASTTAAHGQSAGGWPARLYQALLRRQQRWPWVWGAASGVALGLVGIWIVLAALVIPLEMSSLDLLSFSRLRIDTAHPAGSAPASSDGLLHPSAWQNTPEAGDPAALDAFGRPVQLEAEAAGRYRLRSLGLDGRASGDDLCVSGPAPLAATLADPLVFLERRRAGQVGWVEQVSAIAQARCATSH